MRRFFPIGVHIAKKNAAMLRDTIYLYEKIAKIIINI